MLADRYNLRHGCKAPSREWLELVRPKPPYTLSTFTQSTLRHLAIQSWQSPMHYRGRRDVMGGSPPMVKFRPAGPARSGGAPAKSPHRPQSARDAEFGAPPFSPMLNTPICCHPEKICVCSWYREVRDTLTSPTIHVTARAIPVVAVLRAELFPARAPNSGPCLSIWSCNAGRLEAPVSYPCTPQQFPVSPHEVK